MFLVLTSVLCLVMHILCVNALKLLSGFFWRFVGQDLAFFGEDRLATLPLLSGKFHNRPNASVGRWTRCPWTGIVVWGLWFQSQQAICVRFLSKCWLPVLLAYDAVISLPNTKPLTAFLHSLHEISAASSLFPCFHRFPLHLRWSQVGDPFRTECSSRTSLNRFQWK